MGIKKTQLGIAIGQGQTSVDLAEQPAPAAISNKVRLYSKDVGRVAEFFIRDDDGNEVQITNNGLVNINGGGGIIRDQLVVDETGTVVKITPGIAALFPGDPGVFTIMLNTPLTLYGIGPYLFTCAEHLNLTPLEAVEERTSPVIPSVAIVSPVQINVTIWAWIDGSFEPSLIPWTFAIFNDP